MLSLQRDGLHGMKFSQEETSSVLRKVLVGTDKVYTLDIKKANGNNDLIACMCYMYYQPLFVLFDYGASYSSISSKCVKRLGLEETPLPSSMVVTTMMDNNIETQWVRENYPISINGCVFLIDLICLSFKRIDMVLGIHWLSANLVYISCKEKVIFIPLEAATLGDVMSTLLEGTTRMINSL